jgi:shikimate kinase
MKTRSNDAGTTGTIWLVGMMGAGKSAVGECLAKRLGRPFIDTDAEIERRAGLSIAEIFATRGEPAFRTLERDAIDRVVQAADAVVALGGGAIAQPDAARRLSARGTIVYLRAKPATLAKRIGAAAGRPLLAGLDAAGRRRRITQLLAERVAHYETARIAIDTDGLDPERVAALVERELARARQESA